jgi:CheY-like chemotaxis protein
MDEQLRIMVASALGKVIEPALRGLLPSATVTVATTQYEVEDAVHRRPRFDVVISDLTWNSADEYSFDGLDVLDILRTADRESPVIIATQGHGAEQDHLDEAVEQEIVWGVFRKSAGPGPLAQAIERVGHGQRLPSLGFPTGASRASLPRIHSFFGTARGRTAARMAGAIASGRAVDHKTLAEVAQVRYDTAAKIGREYLGELICRRGEHISPGLPAHVPAPVVYRWCGEHARYILSWCRRNGLTDVATRVIPIV